MKKLLAAGALALACLVASALVASPSAFAATVDPVAGPMLSYEQIAYPAVCDMVDMADVFTIAPAMVECSLPAATPKPSHSFVLATLIAPASIYDLPLDFRIDPGRMSGTLA